MSVINGLSANYYLINNQCWVDIVEIGSDAKEIQLNIKQLAFESTDILAPDQNFVFYPINEASEFNISPIIKGMIGEPNLDINGLFLGEPIRTNYGKYQITISVLQNNGTFESFPFTKIFIRGGERSNRQNVFLADDAVLKESTLIPRWNGYPAQKFYIDGPIRATPIIPATESVQMRVLGKKPIFLRFKNSKGGYSDWLFESYEIDNSAKGGEVIYRRDFNFQLNTDSTQKLKVSGRVTRDYYSTMVALVESQEIYVYNLKAAGEFSLRTDERTWDRIFSDNNKFDYNNYDDLEEVSFSFKLKLSYNPSLI